MMLLTKSMGTGGTFSQQLVYFGLNGSITSRLFQLNFMILICLHSLLDLLRIFTYYSCRYSTPMFSTLLLVFMKCVSHGGVVAGLGPGTVWRSVGWPFSRTS